MWTLLLDFLFPRRSLTGEGDDWITDDELLSLKSAPVILEMQQLRSQSLHSIDRIVAAAEYKKVSLLHRAIHTFKYKKVRGVGEMLGRMLVDVSTFSFPPPAPHQSLGSGAGHPLPQARRSAPCAGEGTRVSGRPVLCPVPLHWVRKFYRGFNQSEILARAVGQARGWEVQNLLKRVRWTGSQVGRRRRGRVGGS